MKKSLLAASVMVVGLAFAGAQQPSSMPAQSGSGTPDATAPASPSQSQMPSAAQPGAAQSAPQASPQASGADANAPITEGCLGGSNPNFTLTGTGGKSYKLALPPNADGSKLTPHVGESIAVMGTVNSDSIAVSKVGKGNGTCPGK